MTAVDELAARTGTWRPYEDPPLLKPEMLLGFDACAPDDRDRLLAFLAALVTARRTPIHVNVAFNAVYFGYDLVESSYVGAIELFDLPRIRAGEVTDALPVGALIDIDATAEPLYAEVVYKEGAHPQIDDSGDAPSWISGAPAGASGPDRIDDLVPPILRERLLVDFDAFGAGFCVSPKQLQRLRRRQRGMDADGHLLLDARYPDRASADLDDVSYYARYLVTSGRDLLLNADLPEPLRRLLSADAGEEQLEAAVRALLDTIHSALRCLDDDLRFWNGYAFTRSSFKRRLQDKGPLGGGDLEALATQMAKAAIPVHVGRRSAQSAIAYTATGPALRTIHDAAPHLSGIDYAVAVCHANTVISDYARREADEHGLLGNGAHLRLDDRWQGGGVWRAEFPGSRYAAVPPDEPLGLGWAREDTRYLASAAQPTGEIVQPQWEPPSPDELEAAADEPEAPLTDSVVSWTQVLRLAHLFEGYLPIQPRIAAQMHHSHLGGEHVSIELAHDGDRLRREEAHQVARVDIRADHPRLTGIDWPWAFNVSMVLTCSWRRHSRLLRLTTTLLDEPLLVDGERIEHRYDPRVHTREGADAAERRCAGGSPAGEPSEAGRVLLAVRRLGLLDADGQAVLARSHLARAVYGSSARESVQLGEAVAQLIATEKLFDDIGGMDIAGRLTYPAAPGQPTVPVLVYRPTPTPTYGRPASSPPGTPKLDLQYVRRGPVSAHLRRIGHLGQEPSDSAKAAYAAHLRSLGMPIRALPPGFTFRREG